MLNWWPARVVELVQPEVDVVVGMVAVESQHPEVVAMVSYVVYKASYTKLGELIYPIQCACPKPMPVIQFPCVPRAAAHGDQDGIVVASQWTLTRSSTQ